MSNEQRADDIVLAESAAHKMMRGQQVGGGQPKELLCETFWSACVKMLVN